MTLKIATDIVTIAGSPTHPSRTAALLDYCAEALSARGHHVKRVIVRDLDPVALLHGQYDSPTLQPALSAIADTQALIVASPVYKASYAGALKCLLDVLPQDGFAGKTILPIVCGAAPVHALALDHCLKPMLAALGAAYILPGLYLLDKQIDYKPVLNFTDPLAKSLLDVALGMLAP